MASAITSRVRSPDFVGVVLHPSRLRIDLLVFLLGAGDDRAGAVENDEARAGGALVDGSDVVRHDRYPAYLQSADMVIEEIQFKMVSAESNATQAQPVAQSNGAPAHKATQSRTPKSSGSDSVQLSQAAQARLAARKESRETPAQTSKEAAGGDRQAQRLLAREAAAKQADK